MQVDDVFQQPDVQAHAARLIARLVSRQSELVELTCKRLLSDIDDLRADAHVVELLTASVEGNVTTFIRIITDPAPIDHLGPPPAAVEYARLLAQRGVRINALVRAYRLGQRAFFDMIYDELKGAGLDADMAIAVMDHLTALGFDYIDWISERVVRVYETERERWLTNQNNLRVTRVREILAGGVVDIDAADTAIGYPLRSTHVGIILHAAERDRPGDRLSRIERFLRTLARRLDATAPPLFVAVDESTARGWIPLAGPGEHTSRRIRELVATTDDPPQLCVGTPRRGVDGFRRSHEEARSARFVSDVPGAPARMFIAADEPGLLAVAQLAQDLPALRGWVQDVLGPLADDDEGHARLRMTLRSYLRHGGSNKAAAEELNLHPNSVKYRVQRAVEQRGRAIGEDRPDVELALAAGHWLGSAVLASPSSEQ